MYNKFFAALDIEQTILHNPLQLTGDTPAIKAVRLMSQVRDTCHVSANLSPSDMSKLHPIEEASCVLVVEKNKLIGIFTEKDLVKCTAAGLNLEQVNLAQIMTKSPVTLKKSQFINIFIALNLFHQHKIRHLAILDDHDYVIGLITLATVRQLLQPTDLFKILCVREVMTTKVIQAPPTKSVFELAQLMTENAVSCVVITNSDSQPIGIVTERDIVQIRCLELDIFQLQAHVVMSAPLFCMRHQQSLWEAHQQMQQRLIRRLVVVDENHKLQGIVTQTSILNSIDPIEMYETINILQQKVEQLEAEKIEILEKQKTALEKEVQERTEKLEQQATTEQILVTLLQKIRNSFDIEDILHTAVCEIRDYLQTDRVVIYKFELEWTGKIVAESLAPGKPSILGRVIHDPCFGKTWVDPYTNGRIRAIPDIYTSGIPDCHLELLEKAEIRANLIVPIVYNQQLWGLLCAHQCYQSRNWETLEMELLKKLSTQIAIALQQSQLYLQARNEIIERQKAEKKLQELNEDLEIIIAQRTQQLEQTNQNLLQEIQERKRIEKNLQKQIAAIEAAGDGIAILNGDKYLYLNQAYMQLFGYDEATELIGKSWKELYQRDEKARLEKDVFPILIKEKHWRGEAIAQRRDGSTFNEQISLTLTEDGELICVCQDITEHKKAEIQKHKLLLELSNFKYALDQSAIVAITDPQGDITYANDNFCEISQYSRDELIGSTHSIVNSGYHSQEFFQNLWSTITKGQVWRGEIKNLAKNGTNYWVDGTIVPFLDDQGKPWQYLAIGNDITNRKNAESALQHSEQKFRQLAENLHQVFWMTDPDTSQMLYISPAYEEIWGLSCASLYENPKSFIDAIHSEDRDKFLLAVQNKTNGFNIEYRIRRPDRSIRWIHDRAFPLQDKTGQVYRVVGIAEDITDRKRVEEEISKALAREKELSELKSRFISMTSHEFRTPLAVISSSAGILKDFGHKLDDDKKKQHLDCILTYVKHTTQLLDDILLINKAENGKLAFEPVPLDLIPFCHKLTEEIQLSSPNHTIVFASQPESGVTANLDKKLLRQILINLLSNAIKYSPPNTTVNFRINITESNLVLSIQDRGIGIPEPDQTKLFESFHRAKNVGNIPGTGLGLSIVAKCVELHKGAITVNSEVGIGTTLIVTIPSNSVILLPK